MASDISDDATHVQASISRSTMAPGSVWVFGQSLRPG
jgi:hypothetical protein